MDAKKLQLKFFSKNKEVDLDKLIPVFHEWIREKKIADELLIDVADYAHVPNGPGVVLIGHQSDYFLDLGEGRPGLLYSRKRGGIGDETGSTLEDRVTDAFTRALKACQLLEQESSLGVTFGCDEAVLRVQDRLNAPNTDASYEALVPALQPAAKRFLGDGATLTRVDDEKGPLTVRISGGDTASVDAALARN